jgi:predicted dehydrogenase
MTAPVRLAFVGCGKRAREHLTHLYDLRDRSYLGDAPDAEDPVGAAYAAHADDSPDWAADVSALDPEVTALVDPDAAQRRESAAVCREAGDDPRAFETTGGFLAADAAADADAVVVTAPNDAHVAVLRAVLRTDLDVLCEKPLATTMAGHADVAAAAASHAGTLYPAFNLRSSPFFRRLAGMVEAGRIGDLGSVTCHEVRRPLAAGYRYDRERSGGSLLEKNVHDFDLFNWVADGDPVRVVGAGGRHVLDADADVDDQASVVVEYDGGTLATLELCLYAPWGQRGRRYELRGSEGLLRTPEAEATVDCYGPDGRERIEVATPGGHLGGDFVQAVRFLRTVRGEADPPGTLADATAAAAVALAAQEAVDTGEAVPVEVPDVPGAA